MTDRPGEHDADLPTAPAEPTAADRAATATNLDVSSHEPTPSRWDGVRPRGRLGQIAAILVATASAVLIAGAIFVAGFAVGSESGDEHHGGDGYSQGEREDFREGDAAEGSDQATAGDESGPESSRDGEGP